MNPLSTLAAIASRYIGAAESPVGSNCGPMVNKFKAATDLNPNQNWPWCAAFVSYCVKELRRERPDIIAPDISPSLAGAYAFEDWGDRHGALEFNANSTRYSPQAGDIVTYRFSHIGIVFANLGGSIIAIEGNTNDAGSREGYIVAKKVRRLDECRRFIRLPVKATKA